MEDDDHYCWLCGKWCPEGPGNIIQHFIFEHPDTIGRLVLCVLAESLPPRLAVKPPRPLLVASNHFRLTRGRGSGPGRCFSLPPSAAPAHPLRGGESQER